jgi:6-phosphogluconolactonase
VEDLDISIYTTEAELLEVTVGEISELVDSQLTSTGKFHLALTGGTLGNLIAKELAAEFSQGDWRGLHIWWSDERFVSLDSPERNDLVFCDAIGSESGVVVHRANGDGEIEIAAKTLEREIAGINMDLVILGMGQDGHIASLFPDAIHADETRDVFAITNSPKPPSSRVTFSLKKINSAAAIWLVASGENKADAVAGLIEQEYSLPVSHVNWSRLLVDSAAFGI